MMTIFRDLPEDLVVEEILCHVPVTYLKRLKSTCKRWNRLFNGDSRFARVHTDKAAKQFLVLLLNKDRICPAIFSLPHGCVEFKSELSLVDPQSMDSAQFDISRAFHCDGLLLCTSEKASRFVVLNPFTGESRWFLPPRNSGVMFFNIFLGYYQEDNTKRYKILIFSHVRKDYDIYEFGSDLWKTLDDIIAPGCSNANFRVSLKGNTYGFATYATKAQKNICLLKFDFQTEKSVRVLLPYQCPQFSSTCLSVVREEKLSVLLQRDATSKTEIWTTNKINETTTQVVSWSKVLALDLCPDLQICDDVNFLLEEEKKVVMMCVRWLDWEDETMGKNMIYTVWVDEKVTKMKLGTGTSILNYVPSLVQIEQARRKRKIGDYSNM